jgi:hypothetical protein
MVRLGLTISAVRSFKTLNPSLGRKMEKDG